MSRPKSSWGDIANFGANVYQARQMNKLANQQAEANALLQMQMEEMRMQQLMADMKKEALKNARTLILEFEDMIAEIKKRVNQNLILASIEADALVMAFNDSKDAGLDSDFFEDMYDLERYRKIQTEIVALKELTSNLNSEQSTIKNNILSYSMEFDDYERAIQLATELPKVQSRNNELSNEISNLKPRWQDFESNAILINGKMTKKENTIVGIVSLIFIPLIVIGIASPETLGQSVSFGEDLAIGSCLAWIIIGGGALAFFEGRKITIPDSETLLGESSESKLIDELALYRSMDEEAISEGEEPLFTEEIKDLENRLQSSNNSDINFIVPHGGEPFEEYYVLLRNTFEKCNSKMTSMNSEFNKLVSSLGMSEIDELSSSLNTKREYVNFYTNENLQLESKAVHNNSIEEQIKWVLHEGYYYKQFANGSFDPIPHIRNNAGHIVPYQTPNPPIDSGADYSNQLSDLDI